MGVAIGVLIDYIGGKLKMNELWCIKNIVVE